MKLTQNTLQLKVGSNRKIFLFHKTNEIIKIKEVGEKHEELKLYIFLKNRPFLTRLASYGQHGSDATFVTPSFTNKTECIKLYVRQDQFIYI